MPRRMTERERERTARKTTLIERAGGRLTMTVQNPEWPYRS
jgi:hypothetical protein